MQSARLSVQVHGDLISGGFGYLISVGSGLSVRAGAWSPVLVAARGPVLALLQEAQYEPTAAGGREVVLDGTLSRTMTDLA